MKYGHSTPNFGTFSCPAHPSVILEFESWWILLKVQSAVKPSIMAPFRLTIALLSCLLVVWVWIWVWDCTYCMRPMDHNLLCFWHLSLLPDHCYCPIPHPIHLHLHSFLLSSLFHLHSFLLSSLFHLHSFLLSSLFHLHSFLLSSLFLPSFLPLLPALLPFIYSFLLLFLPSLLPSTLLLSLSPPCPHSSLLPPPRSLPRLPHLLPCLPPFIIILMSTGWPVSGIGPSTCHSPNCMGWISPYCTCTALLLHVSIIITSFPFPISYGRKSHLEPGFMHRTSSLRTYGTCCYCVWKVNLYIRWNELSWEYLGWFLCFEHRYDMDSSHASVSLVDKKFAF